MSGNLYKHLIKKKTNPVQEWQIFLFTGCDFNCGFCFLSKDQLKDYSKMDTILFQASQLQGEIERLYEQGKKKHVINIMGGELFSDHIEDRYFQDYFSFCTLINSLKAKKDISISFSFITHLCFTKTQRVKDLTNKLKEQNIDISIGTSFDFIGRFNTKSRQLFEHNLFQVFTREYISTVSIILTKPNIKSLISNTDKLYHRIYKEFGSQVFFDYFSPDSDKKSKIFQPSLDDIYQALCFLQKNYPLSQPVYDLINKEYNYMTCRRSLTLLESCGNCQNLVCDKQDFELKDTLSDSMEASFLKKYNCKSCQFFERCGLGCFLSHSYKPTNIETACPYKKFFYNFV